MHCITCLIGQRPLMRDLYICNWCGLISSRYKADPYLYDQAYYDRYVHYKDEEVGRSLIKIRTELVYKHVSKGNLLDFGCATGDFHVSLNSGIKGHGYDINPHFGFRGINNLDVRILTMWDVIEHINDPTPLMRHVNPDYIFISTPSTDDYKDPDFGNWRHYRPHEHVHYFNEKSLRWFLTKHGYEIAEVNYNESAVRQSGGEKNILTMVGVKHNGAHQESSG